MGDPLNKSMTASEENIFNKLNYEIYAIYEWFMLSKEP